MNLGDFYKAKHKELSPSQIIQYAKADALGVLTQSADKRQCEILEEILNEAFYPKEGQSTLVQQQIKQLVEGIYEQKYNNAFKEDFTMNSDGSLAPLENTPTIIREKYERFQHSEYIELQTIKTRLEKVTKYITDLRNLNQLDQIPQELDTLEKELRALSELKTDNNGHIVLKGNDNLLQRVKAVDAAYQTYSQVGGVLSPQDFGDILEYVLNAMGGAAEAYSGAISEAMLEDFAKAMQTKGSENVSIAGERFLNYRPTLKNLNDFVKDKTYRKKVEKKDRTFLHLEDDKGSSLDFQFNNSFNPNSDRQGKIDVEFKLRNGNQILPFRISAKNWERFADRDFGTTSLAYAVARSAGMSILESYVYWVMEEQDNAVEVEAHAMAKYLSILDILMGYSQTSNFADTIVINNRSASHVYVYSMKEILNQVADNLYNFNLNGYEDSAIHNNIIWIRKTLNAMSPGRSDLFETLSIKYLQSIRVSVKYAALMGSITY